MPVICRTCWHPALLMQLQGMAPNGKGLLYLKDVAVAERRQQGQMQQNGERTQTHMSRTTLARRSRKALTLHHQRAILMRQLLPWPYRCASRHPSVCLIQLRCLGWCAKTITCMQSLATLAADPLASLVNTAYIGRVGEQPGPPYLLSPSSCLPPTPCLTMGTLHACR